MNVAIEIETALIEKAKEYGDLAEQIMYLNMDRAIKLSHKQEAFNEAAAMVRFFMERSK